MYMVEFIREKVCSIESEMIARRRDFHKYPESDWAEFRTASIAIKRMQELGYTITMGKEAVKEEARVGVPSAEHLAMHQARAIEQGGDKELIDAMTGGFTGFWADMKFTDDAVTMALRFDMDSNDTNEVMCDSHRPYKEGFASVNKGLMHACGHDGHTAMGLAIADVVASMKDKLKGTIRFIFQPSEESLRGGGPMVAAGAVDGVDYIIGMHVGFKAEKAGQLVCGTTGLLANTKLDAHFYGLASHAGAAPQEGRNALLASAVAALNMHAISRHADGITRVNVGKLTAGEGRNVLPPYAHMVAETRGITDELDKYMLDEVNRIVKAAADMYGCTSKVEIMGSTISGDSDKQMAELVAEIAKDIPYYEKVMLMKDFGAAEDYAYMMSTVQKNGGMGTYIQVGIDKKAGHHMNRFDFDESGLAPAVELACGCIYKILGK